MHCCQEGHHLFRKEREQPICNLRRSSPTQLCLSFSPQPEIHSKSNFIPGWSNHVDPILVWSNHIIRGAGIMKPRKQQARNTVDTIRNSHEKRKLRWDPQAGFPTNAVPTFGSLSQTKIVWIFAFIEKLHSRVWAREVIRKSNQKFEIGKHEPEIPFKGRSPQNENTFRAQNQKREGTQHQRSPRSEVFRNVRSPRRIFWLMFWTFWILSATFSLMCSSIFLRLWIEWRTFRDRDRKSRFTLQSRDEIYRIPQGIGLAEITLASFAAISYSNWIQNSLVWACKEGSVQKLSTGHGNSVLRRKVL